MRGLATAHSATCALGRGRRGAGGTRPTATDSGSVGTGLIVGERKNPGAAFGLRPVAVL